MVLEVLSADSLDNPQSLADQTLISGKKKCLAVYKKAQQTPTAKARLFKEKRCFLRAPGVLTS